MAKQLKFNCFKVAHGWDATSPTLKQLKTYIQYS